MSDVERNTIPYGGSNMAEIHTPCWLKSFERTEKLGGDFGNRYKSTKLGMQDINLGIGVG